MNFKKWKTALHIKNGRAEKTTAALSVLSQMIQGYINDQI